MTQYRIKSKFLSVVTEAVHKLTFTEDDIKATPPEMDDDGNFVSDIESDKELDIPGVEIEKKDPEKKKADLVAQASEKLRGALDIAAELDKILDAIREVDSELNISNDWVLNDEGNDVYLQSKDAHIFQQNSNILLSHDGKIEIFKTVPELHNWLEKNDYPLPPAVEIHESTDEQVLKLLDEAEESDEKNTKEGFYVFDAEENVVAGPFKSSVEAENWIEGSGDQEEFKKPLTVDYIGE